MIGFIQGTVKNVHEDALLILAGSLGYEVFVPNAQSYSLDTSVEFYIYSHWNQEQGQSLFGFSKHTDKMVFQLALKCPGVGPRLALCILETIGAGAFLQALAAEDSTVLSSISGIGKKKAEQLIVQLKHHVTKLIEKGVTIDEAGGFAQFQQLSEVLSSLNYSRPEINHALDRLKKEELQTPSFDILLRKALSYLSKRA